MPTPTTIWANCIAIILDDPQRAAAHLQRYVELRPRPPIRDLVKYWIAELQMRPASGGALLVVHREARLAYRRFALFGDRSHGPLSILAARTSGVGDVQTQRLETAASNTLGHGVRPGIRGALGHSATRSPRALGPDADRERATERQLEAVSTSACTTTHASRVFPSSARAGPTPVPPAFNADVGRRQ